MMTKKEVFIETKKRGFYVDEDGNIFSRFKQLKPWIEKRYYCIGVQIKSQRYHVRVHQLQAYQKYGDAIFEPGIMIRHLNDNGFDNRLENISIGTASDNIMDRPIEIRKKLEKPVKVYNTEYNLKGPRKYSDEQIAEWKRRRDLGHTFMSISRELNVEDTAIRYWMKKIS